MARSVQVDASTTTINVTKINRCVSHEVFPSILLGLGEGVTYRTTVHLYIGAPFHMTVAAAAKHGSTNPTVMDIYIGGIDKSKVLELLSCFTATATVHLTVVDPREVVVGHLHGRQQGVLTDRAALDDDRGKACAFSNVGNVALAIVRVGAYVGQGATAIHVMANRSTIDSDERIAFHQTCCIGEVACIVNRVDASTATVYVATIYLSGKGFFVVGQVGAHGAADHVDLSVLFNVAILATAKHTAEDFRNIGAS